MVNTTLDDDRTTAAIDHLLNHQVDAIMFAAVGTRSVVLPAAARRASLALVNTFCSDETLPTFLPDEQAGARAMAQHLLALGHRDIAMLAGVREAWATQVRVQETASVSCARPACHSATSSSTVTTRSRPATRWP